MGHMEMWSEVETSIYIGHVDIKRLTEFRVYIESVKLEISCNYHDCIRTTHG